MYRKKRKTHQASKKKKEELPSFLSNLTGVPEEIELPTKPTKSEVYLGAIFFGVCKNYHPPHHSLKLDSFNLVQYVAPSRENFLEAILINDSKKPESQLEPFKHVIPKPKKKKRAFSDPYLHKCPGKRRIFAYECKVRVPDLGETTAKIVGETSREIQYCRIRNFLSSESDPDIEVVTLSDIREKNRIHMSSNERAAHAHFPKEFRTVLMCGPKIPASIGIRQLPSKRRKLSDYGYNVISKTVKKQRKVDNLKEKEEMDEEVTETISLEAGTPQLQVEVTAENQHEEVISKVTLEEQKTVEAEKLEDEENADVDSLIITKEDEDAADANKIEELQEEEGRDEDGNENEANLTTTDDTQPETEEDND